MPLPDEELLFRAGLPTLRSNTLVLRAPKASDAEDVYALYCDKEATRFGYSPKMDNLDDAHTVMSQIVQLAKERTLFHWFVATLEQDRVVGHATLFQWVRDQRRAEIGYSVRKDLWGRGIATEAVSTLLDFSFGSLQLRRVEADVDPRNHGSLRVLAKLGFEREGYLRERWELQGEIQDAVLFGLLERSWTARRATSALG